MMIGTVILGKPYPWDAGLYSSCQKIKKINTKISTKAELIGADDAITQIFWTKYFIEAQGYGIDEISCTRII